ncbi:MAG: FG-GAP repeat protein [Acidobacteria bacterium]|nr:FG-GAP repeat protein [Acidobacteriota bacterium]
MRRVLTRPGFLIVVVLSAAFYLQRTKFTVGAASAPLPLNSDSAAAQLIVPPLAQLARLVAGDGAAEDMFGSSVSISGDTLVVGVKLDDVGANVNQGSAYVFVRSGGVWSLQKQFIDKVTDSAGMERGAPLFFVSPGQINVRLSRALIRRGEVDVALSVDGKAANTVRVSIC